MNDSTTTLDDGLTHELFNRLSVNERFVRYTHERDEKIKATELLQDSMQDTHRLVQQLITSQSQHEQELKKRNNYIDELLQKLVEKQEKHSEILESLQFPVEPKINPHHEVPGSIVHQPVKPQQRPMRFLPKTTRHLIIGDSMIKGICMLDMPVDIILNAYPGSTSVTKMDLIEDYNDIQLESVTIQDGINMILPKPEKEISEIFEYSKKLVEAIKRKFKPTKIFYCQVMPVNYSKENTEKNGRVKEFNDLLDVFCQKEDIEVTHQITRSTY